MNLKYFHYRHLMLLEEGPLHQVSPELIIKQQFIYLPLLCKELIKIAHHVASSSCILRMT